MKINSSFSVKIVFCRNWFAFYCDCQLLGNDLGETDLEHLVDLGPAPDHHDDHGVHLHWLSFTAPRRGQPGKTGTFWGGLCDHWLCQCSADLFLLPLVADHSPDHFWWRHWRYGYDFRHVSDHGCGDCCLHGSFCRTPLAPLYSGCARDGDRFTQGANGDSGVWRGAG